MEDLDRLHDALMQADAAGDKAGAQVLADHIRALSAPAAAATPAAPQGVVDKAWDGIKNFGLGVAKGVMSPVDGGAQLLSNGVAKLANLVAPDSDTAKSLSSEAQRVNDINTDRENKYQAMTPGSVAAGVGNVLGNVIVPIGPAAGAVRGATLAGKLGRAAVTGGTIGAVQPVYNAGSGDQPASYWDEKGKQVALGTVLGGAMGGAGSALGGLASAAQPLIQPAKTVGNMLSKQLAKASGASTPEEMAAALRGDVSGLTGSKAPGDVLQRLQDAQSLVPGSLPTTAQVAGVPELVMAEKTLKNNPAYRGAFEDRSTTNNQARLAQLLQVAKTPQDLQSAIDARASASSPLYDAAGSAQLPIDDTLKSLMNRPSGLAAMARGRKIAAERGDPIGVTDGTAAVPPAPSSILDASGNPFAGAGTPEVPATMSGKALQYMKMGIDALQSEGRTTGISSHEANALAGTQNDLTKWIEQQSPDYAKANQTYASLSQPVNTMEAAQALHGGLANGTLNATGDISPALSQYRTQLAKALKNSPYGIEPGAQKSLEAIQSDLQRETISNSIKSAGSDTMFNAQAPNWLSGKLYGDSLDGKSKTASGLAGLAGFLNGGPLAAAGASMASQKIGQFAGNRVNAEFQKAMLDPKHFAKLLSEAIDRNNASGLLDKLTPVGARATTYGAENIAAPGAAQ